MDGIGIALTSIGGILVYAGIKGYSLPDVVRNVVTGQPIATNVGRLSVGNGAGGSNPVETPETGPSNDSWTLTPNQKIGKELADTFGWGTGLEWSALLELWNRESSWSNTARNPSSGAYGIPQALPPDKLPPPGQAPPVGTSDARSQIAWGLNYIESRYRTPIFALAHHKTYNWY
jgi:hypothetical protein